MFFERVKALADWQRLIDAWASMKSFRPKGGDGSSGPGRNPEVNFKGRPRANETHALSGMGWGS